MRLIDLTGQRFGRLVVTGRAENHRKRTHWNCICDCGNVVSIDGARLRGDVTHSCGCIKKETIGALNKTHGGSNSRLYVIWLDMMRRCSKPNDKEYHRYGGRGISVCDEWKDFATFQKWATETGYNANAKRGECTIERKDPNGNYCPDNCCWTDNKSQANNRRSNHFLEYNGESHTIAEWGAIVGIAPSTISARINAHGWSVEKALTTPLCKNQHG